jgi:diguanylate cyclase (GGDEF)-like protein
MTQLKMSPTDDLQGILAGLPVLAPVRTVRVTRSRVDALTRLVRTAFGLPSAQGRRTEAEPVERLLTVREQALSRARTRRSLRAATVLGGFTLTAVALPFDLGITLLVPGRQLELVAIFGIEALFIIVVTILALAHRRVPALPLAFALAFSLSVEMSYLLAFVPELWKPSLMLLALLPPAIALFTPWSARAQAGWLLASASVLAVVTGIFGGGAVRADEMSVVWLILSISGLVSLAGALGTARMRIREFKLQMEARSSHIATLAREVELERLNVELAMVTLRDPLTGLGNRRRLDEELTAAAARATRYDNDCAIALLDLDGFKTYNDTLGHLCGDTALRAVAAALIETVRATDKVCRFGGDEFVVVMPEQALEGAARTADRIRQAVADLGLRYPTPGGPQVLTISAGVALLGRSAARDGDEVLRQADAELYRAKAAGRKPR